MVSKPKALWCPRCGARHVDAGEWATFREHHKHLCHACGGLWDPCDTLITSEGPHGGVVPKIVHAPTVGVSDRRIIELGRAALLDAISSIENLRAGGNTYDEHVNELREVQDLMWTVENHEDGASELGELYDEMSMDLGRMLKTAVALGGNAKVLIKLENDDDCVCDNLDKLCVKHLTMEDIDRHRVVVNGWLEEMRSPITSSERVYLLRAKYHERVESIDMMLREYRKARGL